jgi:hypothetical protein
MNQPGISWLARPPFELTAAADDAESGATHAAEGTDAGSGITHGTNGDCRAPAESRLFPLVRSAARSVANTIGREISCGLLGRILGGGESRKR